jgi:hypothetical protein
MNEEDTYCGSNHLVCCLCGRCDDQVGFVRLNNDMEAFCRGCAEEELGMCEDEEMCDIEEPDSYWSEEYPNEGG